MADSTTIPQDAETPAEAGASRSKTNRIARGVLRAAVLIFITFSFGWVLNKSASASSQNPAPAGFGRGMLHGALMPGAMPTLLLGRDVVIFAEHNTGRTYKLGYTVGVNACGAFFFGSFYWRLVRWRKKYGQQRT